MKLQKVFLSRYIFLIITFFLMCILKNPFTLFILFLVAILLSIFAGKNIYCNSFCPMGTITTDVKKNRKINIQKQKNIIKGIGLSFIVVFWILFIYIAVKFYISHNFILLWVHSLRLMVGTMFVAILLGVILNKNRAFCIYACPLRITILNPILSLKKIINKRR